MNLICQGNVQMIVMLMPKIELRSCLMGRR